MDYRTRQKRLNAELEKQNLDALLITHLPNVRYLSGFTGSAAVLLAGERTSFFTDGRYREQATQEVAGAKVVVGKGGALSSALDAIRKCNVRRLGIEADHMTVATRSVLARELGKSVSLVETSGTIEHLRTVKDAAEISCMRASVNLAAKLFGSLVRTLTPGVAESVVAAKLEYKARRAGAEGMSFETIVAGGERSALPHGVASSAKLPSRGFVVLDYGVILNGYCSDMTRTVCIGRPTVHERAVYEAVLEAQLAGIAAVAPGASTGDVDEAARSVLRKAKLSKYFTHSIGHGVGLEVHEQPRVAAQQKSLLEPGMVITIEPGVYVPGEFGVRIEDMVLVTEGGYEVLTPATKEFTAV